MAGEVKMASDQGNRIVNVADYGGEVEKLVRQIIETTDKIAYVTDVVNVNTLLDIEDNFARACQPLADRLGISDLDFVCRNADQIVSTFEQVLDKELVDSIWKASDIRHDKKIEAERNNVPKELFRLRNFYVDQLLGIVGTTTSIEYGKLNISLSLLRDREWKVSIL
jgi:hypothetical protein